MIAAGTRNAASSSRFSQAVLASALLLARDHFVATAHRLADVGKADLREFAQDLLNRDLGALGPAAQDFRNSCRCCGLWL